MPLNNMKYQHSRFPVIWLLLFCVLILLAGIVYTEYDKKTDNNSPTAEQKPTIVPTTHHADWKTYTSPNGFSFQYPSTMTFGDTGLLYDVVLVNAGTNDYSIVVWNPIIHGPEMALPELLKGDFYQFEQTKSLKITHGLTVEGKPAYRGEGKIDINDSKITYQIIEGVLLDNNKYIKVEASATKNTTPEALRKVLDEVLATFHFSK